MRSRWRRVLLGLFVSLVLLLPALLDERPELIKSFEQDLYDIRLRSTLSGEIDPRIVIVDIDEKSLAVVGRWPWSRATIAQLIQQMFDRYGITLAGFDMVFSEPDTRVELEQVRTLLENVAEISDRDALIEQLNPDRKLAGELAKWPVTMGYLFSQSSNAPAIGQPTRAVTINAEDLISLPIPRATGVISSLSELQLSAASGGFFDNPLVDSDGVFRRIALLQRYKDQYYPALSLALLLELFGEQRVHALVEADSTGQMFGLTALDVAGLEIPVDEQGAMLVPYRGGQGSFTYISAVDILNGMADPKALEGAIALVGSSAAGLLDLRVTPVATRFAGVEVHANALSAMLDERFLSIPDYTLGFEIIQLVLTAVLLSLVIPFVTAIGALILAAVWGVLLVGFNMYAWIELSWVIPIGYTLAVMLLLLVVLQLAGYLAETRHALILQSQFGQYVPPAVVSSLADSEAEVSLTGESRELTIFFSDVRGFTAISEGLSPSQLARLMNLYLSEMTEVIHNYSGTVDKYIGDAVMAFWGAPMPDGAHAQHALEAALAMQARISSLNPRLVDEGLPEIRVGMGLNTDWVNVGNMGSTFRMAYTALGDGVNLASRLESLTKFYQLPILVSEALCQQIKGILFRPVDLVRVKGRDEPVEIFQPLGRLEEMSEYDLRGWSLYSEAVADYRDCDWSSAREKLLQFQALCPDDPLIPLYLQRITAAEGSPAAEGWSAVFNHTEK